MEGFGACRSYLNRVRHKFVQKAYPQYTVDAGEVQHPERHPPCKPGCKVRVREDVANAGHPLARRRTDGGQRWKSMPTPLTNELAAERPFQFTATVDHQTRQDGLAACRGRDPSFN